MRDNEDFDGVQHDTFNDASAGFIADHDDDAFEIESSDRQYAYEAHGGNTDVPDDWADPCDSSAGVMTRDEIRAEIRRLRGEWITGDASARAITGPQLDELQDMLAMTDGEPGA
jgi:hypothetical protein